MKGIRILVLVALCMLINNLQAQVIPSFGNSRTGTAGMQFLKVFPDARSAGMGGAFSTSVQDASSIYWNPAGITHIGKKDLDIQLNNTSYFGGIGLQQASAAFRINKYGYAGLSVVSLNYGDIKETDEFNPFGTGRTFTINNTAVTGSFAKQLTANFRFGVSAKWAHEGIAGIKTNNFLFDLGLLYDVGVKNMRFAVTITNFGVNAKPDGKLQLVKFDGDATVQSFQSVSVPGIFRIGFSFDPIINSTHQLTVAGQLNHYTDNNETFSLGAEYNWRKILYVRSGYEFGEDETGWPACGIGINLKRKAKTLRIDYGFANKSRLGSVHRLGLAFTLPIRK